MKIRITGVPEHFNLPWKICIREKEIDAIWIDEPSGTGAMCKALRDGKTDMAILLTEGIVLDIEKGNPSTILDIHVNSPLIWGIHTSFDRKETSIKDFKKPIYAISRFQSGSHLMAVLEARLRNQSLDASQWNEVQNIDGAVSSLMRNESDLFFWEKFMTSPWLEKNTLKRIGEFPTPWPSFVVVARNDFLASHENKIRSMISLVQTRAKQLQQDERLPQLIAQEFGLSMANAESWTHAIDWNTSPANTNELQELKNNVIKSIR